MNYKVFLFLTLLFGLGQKLCAQIRYERDTVQTKVSDIRKVLHLTDAQEKQIYAIEKFVERITNQGFERRGIKSVDGKSTVNGAELRESLYKIVLTKKQFAYYLVAMKANMIR